MAKSTGNPSILTESPLVMAPVLCAGQIVAVNGLDGALEGAPEDITVDIDYWLDGVAYREEGIVSGWRIHDNDIDGVTVKVYPLKVGTKIVVWVGPDEVVPIFIERIALRSCSGGA